MSLTRGEALKRAGLVLDGLGGAAMNVDGRVRYAVALVAYAEAVGRDETVQARTVVNFSTRAERNDAAVRDAVMRAMQAQDAPPPGLYPARSQEEER